MKQPILENAPGFMSRTAARRLGAITLALLLMAGGRQDAEADVVIDIRDNAGFVTVYSTGGNLDLSRLALGATSGGFWGNNGLIGGGTGYEGNIIGVGASGMGGHRIYISALSTISQVTTGGWVTPGPFALPTSISPPNGFAFLLQTVPGNRIWTPATTSATALNPIGAFSYTSAAPATVAGLGLVDGSAIAFDWGDDNLTFTVNGGPSSAAAVPEPSTALGVLGVVFVAFLRRKRRVLA